MAEPSSAHTAAPAGDPLSRHNLGFLLAKASQRWNELLYEKFVAAGFPEVRPSYGSILIPLYEQDGLRMGEIARRARLSKQTITTMVRLVERDGLAVRRQDPEDGRASRVFLTARAQALRAVAAETLDELDRAVAEALPHGCRDDLDGALRTIADLEARHRSPGARSRSAAGGLTDR